MEYCTEYVQDMLVKLGYVTRGTTHPTGNENDDEDEDISGTVDEEFRDDVFSDRDDWYGRMIHVMQTVMGNTTFSFTNTVESFSRKVGG